MANGSRFRELQAQQIMTRHVESVSTEDPIQYVVHLFNENNISAAAVLDGEGTPIGVITKTDIVRYEEERQMGTNGEDTVKDWMTPVIFSVKPDISMKEIARRMVRYGIHHIFVRGRNGERLMGIVSSFDVLRHIALPGA